MDKESKISLIIIALSLGVIGIILLSPSEPYGGCGTTMNPDECCKNAGYEYWDSESQRCV